MIVKHLSQIYIAEKQKPDQSPAKCQFITWNVTANRLHKAT